MTLWEKTDPLYDLTGSLYDMVVSPDDPVEKRLKSP